MPSFYARFIDYSQESPLDFELILFIYEGDRSCPRGIYLAPVSFSFVYQSIS
jgi:hypothetical protein